MRKKILFILPLILVLVSGILAQQAGSFSLHLTPGVNIPLSTSRDLYTIGGGAALTGEYALPPLPLIFVKGSLDYSIAPTLADTTLSLVSFGAGAGLNFAFIPREGLNSNLS